MNKLIKSENFMAVVVIFILYFFVFHYSFLLLIGLLLVPDLSAIGYIVNTRFGVITYNVFHHLVLPSIVLVVSIFLI